MILIIYLFLALRIRQMAAHENRMVEGFAEATARETIHGYSKEELTQVPALLTPR